MGLWSRRGALGNGGGDGFVGAPGGVREVDGGATVDGRGALDFGDSVGAEAADRLAGFAFFPGAKEKFSGAGIGAESVGVDDAFGAVVVDAQGRPGADVWDEGLGGDVNRLGLRGLGLGFGGGCCGGRGLAVAEEEKGEQKQATG